PGVFASPGTGYPTAGAGPYTVTVADFNGDGKLDIAAADASSGVNKVSVFTGTGTGTFGAASTFTVGAQPNGITNADFNNDGKPDLATANSASGANSVTVLLNTTTTLATPATASASPNPICPNALLTLTGGPAGMSDYSWSGPNSYAVNAT